MKQRINYSKIAPKAIKGIQEMENYIAHSDLEHSLIELVKLRASQINGCAFCIDMHTKDARNSGETEQRLYTLSVWRETDFYTKKELPLPGRKLSLLFLKMKSPIRSTILFGNILTSKSWLL